MCIRDRDNPKENGLCHKYIEQKMGRPVWTHEFAFKEEMCIRDRH